MTNNKSERSEFDSSNFIVFLLKWRKPLIIISMLAAIVSAAISLMIENKYLSTVIMFPANNSSLSKAVMTEDHASKHDISTFGEEEHAEAMLQILNSDEIKWKLWGKYNMMDHYEIDPEDEFAATELSKTWEGNVSFKRTEFNSIRIDVMDASPDTAALLANEIAALVDSTKNKMLRERATEAFKVIDGEFKSLQVYMKELDDSLTVIRQKGVHEYEKQIEMITGEYYKAVASGNSSAERKLKAEMDTLAKYGSDYVSMTENLEYLRERYVLLKGKHDEVKVDANQTGTHKFIVNKAVPAEKKAYPIRWMIVVLSTLAAFVITILAIIGFDNYRRFSDQI